MVLLFECGKYAEQNTAAANQNHFWHWIRNLGRITQPGRKSRSTTTEYRIPPSREYQLWRVPRDIPTCPKFRIASPSTPPSWLEFPGGALPKLLSQSSSVHNSLLFEAHCVDKASRLSSAIVMCVRSHNSPHLVLPLFF